MKLNGKQTLVFFALLVICGIAVGLALSLMITPDPEVVEVHHTDTLYVGYVDSLSVNGRKWDVERDYGFDRIFPIYHYKIIRVSGLCGAGYEYDDYSPLYGERECGFIYFDEGIKGSDKATMNIYRCYDTTYDTTCYQIEDCEGAR